MTLAVTVFALHIGKLKKRKQRGSFTKTMRTDKQDQDSHRRHQMRQFCFKSLAVIYAPTMNFAFKLVMCKTVDAHGAYDEATDSFKLIRKRVIQAHPHFECNNGPRGPRLEFSTTGASFPVYGLALGTLLFVGVVYPIATFVTLLRLHMRRHVTILSGDERSLRVWEELVEREWLPTRWFFLHLHILNSFTLAFSAGYFANVSNLEISISGAWGVAIDAFVIGLLLGAYCWTQPYREEHRWRYNIQKLLLVTALLLAVVAILAALDAESEGKDTESGLKKASRALSFFVLMLMNIMFIALCKSFWEVVVLEKRSVDVKQARKAAKAKKKEEELTAKALEDNLTSTIASWVKGAKKRLDKSMGRSMRSLTGPFSKHDGEERTSQFSGENPLHWEQNSVQLSAAEERSAARLAKLTQSVRAPSMHKKCGSVGVTLAAAAAEEEKGGINSRYVMAHGDHYACTPEEAAAKRALGRSVDKLGGKNSVDKLKEAMAGGHGRPAAKVNHKAVVRTDSEIALMI